MNATTFETMRVIVNHIREVKGLAPLAALAIGDRLREDCGLDSLDLAEMTVRLEHKFGVDVFRAGVITTVGQAVERIESNGHN